MFQAEAEEVLLSNLEINCETHPDTVCTPFSRYMYPIFLVYELHSLGIRTAILRLYVLHSPGIRRVLYS